MDVRQMFPNGLTIADLVVHIPESARWRTATPSVPKPRSLADLAPRPPLLDPGLLPPVLRAWTTDVAGRLGVPLAAIAAPALVSVGALIGSTKAIQPRQFDPDWVEPANLWGMTVAASGLRKSPSLISALRPLRDIEKARDAEYNAEMHKYAARRAILEREIKALERSSSKPARSPSGTSTTDEERLAKLYEDLATVPTEPPRILTNDVTQERLVTLVQANPRGIFQARDEMSGFLNTMAHRDGHEGYRSTLMEGYSAGASQRVDRMSRASNLVDPFTVSFYGLIQPSVLQQHIRTLNQTAGGDGFFARMQLLVSLHKDQVTRGVDRPDDALAKTRAYSMMRVVNATALDSLASQPKGHHRLVRFDLDAQEHFDRWADAVDQQCREMGGSAFAEHLGKTPGAAARLASILHEIDIAQGAQHANVTLEQVQRATGLMDFFAEQARLLYDGEHHPHAILARAIAEKIDSGKVLDGMKVTQVATLFDAKARGSTKDVQAALQILADLHWLTVEQVANDGAPPSNVVRLSPWLNAAPLASPPLQS